jgi:chromosome partitioning protein
MPPVRTIAVINQKGGVGKTTTVANLGSAIAAAGHDTCLLDMDPQAHLTLHLGVEPDASQAGMYDVMTADVPLSDAIVAAGEHLWLTASTIDLAAAEVELVGQVGREQILRDRLEALAGRYEFVLIDCPPSLGLLTLNALAAADDVLIPLQPHFLALQGLGKLLETVSLVQRRINPRLRVIGVILCMYETSTRLAGEVVADLRGFFEQSRGRNLPWSSARIFESIIRRNVKLAECPSYGKTIFDYEPRSNGASDYKSLADEFLAQYGVSASPPQPKATAGQVPPPAAQGDAATAGEPSPSPEKTDPAAAAAGPPAKAPAPA